MMVLLLLSISCVITIVIFIPACGQACAAGSLLVATLIELYRRTRPSMRQSLGGTSLMASSMPGLLLAPQYLLLGLADALSSPTASFLVFVTVPSSYRRAATQLSALLCRHGSLSGHLACAGTQPDIWRYLLSRQYESGPLGRVLYHAGSCHLHQLAGFLVPHKQVGSPVRSDEC
uniref:Uncharacterized protein n=1 Tax=Eptatretus burgeri TaxID=7764 RepID=A0A8C4X0Q3_EPTBU